MIWAVCLLLTVAPDLSPYASPPVSEEARIIRITGNDRVTLGIDTQGSLAQLRWPSRGFSDHLNYNFDASPAAAGGARWVFQDESGFYQFQADTWHVTHSVDSAGALVSHFEEREGDRSAVQRVYVASDRDVVVVELEFEGFSPTLRCFWNQRLSPSFLPVPGLPSAYVEFQRTQGFGTYYDLEDDMVVQFRPWDPGHEAWEHVRRLARENTSSAAWSVFGNGAYWGIFSPHGTMRRYCGPPSTSIESLLKMGSDAQGNSVAGPGQVLIEPTPQGLSNNRRGAIVCIAVAPSNGRLRELRRTVREDALPTAAEFPRRIDPTHDESVRALLACIDGPSGGVVRAPITYPPIAYARVFDSAWASAALDDQGLSVLATRVLDFHLEGAGKNEPGY